VPDAPAHLDRCWLELAEKRQRRIVRPAADGQAGEIGLVSDETVIA